MKPSERKQLLNEILGDDELSQLRETTLTRSLDALRWRTRRRQSFQIAAITALLLVLVWPRRPRQIDRVASNTTPAPTLVATAETGRVKFISEKELLALFPNRPIALIGEPGHQRFLLLDELPKTSTQ